MYCGDEGWQEMLRLTDFRIAGFMVARGVIFSGTEIGPNGDVIFLFEDSENTPNAEETKNSYPGSDEWRYDAACKTMYEFVKMRKRHG